MLLYTHSDYTRGIIVLGYSIQKVSFDEEWGDGSGDMNGFSIKVGYEF